MLNASANRLLARWANRRGAVSALSASARCVYELYYYTLSAATASRAPPQPWNTISRGPLSLLGFWMLIFGAARLLFFLRRRNVCVCLCIGTGCSSAMGGSPGSSSRVGLMRIPAAAPLIRARTYRCGARGAESGVVVYGLGCWASDERKGDWARI